MLASLLAASLCFDVSSSIQGAASLAARRAGLSAFISGSLIKQLTATTTEDWDKDWRGALGAGEDKRCRHLPVNLWQHRFMTCGTDVFRVESSATAEEKMQFVPPLDEARVWFSGVRGPRGWTQPATLLSAGLLEEISLISWTKNVSPVSKSAEGQKRLSWFPGYKPGRFQDTVLACAASEFV